VYSSLLIGIAILSGKYDKLKSVINTLFINDL